MADDPHRDILPVKEGSCVGTCRSTLVAGLISDPRERHSVRKLDRYELEDRYLCLLDESQALKKLLNSQEDKLKRLTTKLMRITASTRPCLAALALDDGKIRMAELERENAKLKERMFVLKSQIFSYRGVRVSPQRRCTHCTSSRPLTCRSEGTRTKTSTSTLYEERKTEYEAKQRMKIEELESQRQDMLGRISELEEELTNCKARLEKEREREVIVDNKQCEEALEMIKEQEKKLSAAEESNASLKREIENLRQRLEEKSNDHERISAALLAEKNRMTEVDGILAKTHDSEMSLREKDEQIRALTSEIKILQQHNAELIALSTQGSEVEVENANLRKQLAEQQADHNNLKSSFSLEQANITALQAVDSQLMEKLQNLQTHMDSLTIELKTIQSQNGKSEKSEKTKNSGKLGSPESPKTEIKTLYRKSEISDTSEKSEVEKLLYEKSEKFEESERAESNSSDQSEIRRSIERVDKMTSMTPRSRRHSKDNESPRLSNSPRNTIERKESSTQTDKMTTSPREFCSTDRLNQEPSASPRSHGKPVELITTSPRNNGKSVDMITSGGLTGDEMLKLLDQAQINDKPKILQYENYSPRNRQRQVMALETLLFGDTSIF